MPQPLVWQDTYPAKVGGAETLLFRSCIHCPLGQGKIEFLTSGQLPIPPELSQQIKETKEEADEALKQAELEKNSVGEAGLLEGAIPIWGSGRDLIHSIQTGDGWGTALNAGFLVWDAASVVAGVFSFGTATVAMAGAKAGVRGLLKAGVHVAANAAKKQLAELAAKSLALKNGLKNIRPFLAKIPRICVTACFPAGTPVAVAGGYTPIEELQVGHEVWAWDEQTGNLALKPVTQTLVRETDALVELQVGADTVRATPEHPFWANGGWTVAGELAAGDELLRSDGLTMPVGRVTHHSERSATVYNVEVADFHTYLVSWWMFVVHNSTICLLTEIKLFRLAHRYKKEVEALTGLAVHPKQIAELKKALRAKKYTKLTADETAKSRKAFNNAKNSLIEKWEKETGQQWPRYDQDVLSKKGKPYIKKGDKYDAHHLIENTYGGEHEWWNIHPARNPDIHQGGIHGKDGLSRLLFPD